MTLTDTVSSIAHDAAQTATELGKQAGKQARVLGRSAADAATDAATTAASSAHHLVNAVSNKVPTVTVTTQKKRPWKTIMFLAIIAVVGAVFVKSKSGSSVKSSSADDTANRPVAIRKTA